MRTQGRVEREAIKVLCTYAVEQGARKRLHVSGQCLQSRKLARQLDHRIDNLRSSLGKMVNWAHIVFLGLLLLQGHIADCSSNRNGGPQEDIEANTNQSAVISEGAEDKSKMEVSQSSRPLDEEQINDGEFVDQIRMQDLTNPYIATLVQEFLATSFTTWISLKPILCLLLTKN